MRALLLLALVATADAAPGKVVRVEHREPTAAPSKGPLAAPVTMELFFVPTAGPRTRRAFREVEALEADHPTRLRLVYRVMLQNDPLLPTAALEAQAQGKFFDFLDALDKSPDRPTRDKLFELWKRLGLDARRLEYALSEHHPYQQVLDDNANRFERLHGGAPPNVLVNSRPPRNQTASTLSRIDLRDLYQRAYDDALDKLDAGVAMIDLPAIYDREAIGGGAPVVVFAGPTDDEDLGPRDAPPLLSPPLALRGMPSLGRESAGVTITVLCSPTNARCAGNLEIAGHMQSLYPEDVRVTWAPWFDVSRDDTAELAMLADAALCAETIGEASGWRWVLETYKQIALAHGRHSDPEALIDTVAKRVDVDNRRLASCRARNAGQALDWVAAARRSGIRTSPAIVVGGRAYPGLYDRAVLQQLVEAELAPGVLGAWPTWH